MLLQPHGRALAACRGVVAGSFGESGHNALRGTQEDVFRGVTASASKAIGATPVNRATVAAGRARPRGRKLLATYGILSTNPVDNTVVIAALPEARLKIGRAHV